MEQKTKCREEFFVKKKGVNERKVALSNLKDENFSPRKLSREKNW